jgi:ABC-type transport system involved in multi-copper enzyme maturation permease subunit
VIELHRFKIQFKIIQSSIVWAALGYALFLLTISFFLEDLHFVREMELVHIKGIYEIGFSLFAVFLFSQLFSEEMEEGMFRWLLSMPINPWIYLIERWFWGITLLIFIYTGSMFCIDRYVIEIPWDKFIVYILIPSLVLGHFAMFITIISQNEWLGMAAPLFYWALEALSQGMLTQQYYLFHVTFSVPDSSIEWNRMMLFFASSVLWLMSGWLIGKRSYFLK